MRYGRKKTAEWRFVEGYMAGYAIKVYATKVKSDWLNNNQHELISVFNVKVEKSDHSILHLPVSYESRLRLAAKQAGSPAYCLQGRGLNRRFLQTMPQYLRGLFLKLKR